MFSLIAQAVPTIADSPFQKLLSVFTNPNLPPLGIAKGSMYALVALGYTMVYGVLGMINFAHGEIFMIGMFSCLYALGFVSGIWGDHQYLNLLVSILAAMLLAASYGYANERIAYRKLRNAHPLAPLTSAIGVSTFLQYFIFLNVSGTTVNFPEFYSKGFEKQIFIGPFPFSYLHLTIVLVTAIVMAVLFYLIQYTRVGLSLRAIAQDQLMASLVGIPVNRTIAFSFIIGSALAAIAGVMNSMDDHVAAFDVGYKFGLKAFTAAVLGGIGNFPGAVLGGLLIGLTETYTSALFGNEWTQVSTFALLMLVLLVRPRGLLGERVADKV